MLTDAEYDVNEKLGECFSLFQALPVFHPADLDEMARAIHMAQNIVLSRGGLRDPRYKGRDDLPRRSNQALLWAKTELQDRTGLPLFVGDKVSIDLPAYQEYVAKHFTSAPFNLGSRYGVILGAARFAETALVGIEKYSRSPIPVPCQFIARLIWVDPIAPEMALAFEISRAQERIEENRYAFGVAFQADQKTEATTYEEAMERDRDTLALLARLLANLYLARARAEARDVTE